MKSKRLKKLKTRNGAIEKLESRQLMAADFSGVVRGGTDWLFDTDKDPQAEITQRYGLPGEMFHVSGSWTGGRDRPGVVRQGNDGLLHWLLDTDGDPNPNLDIAFGLPNDRPVVGDWDGDGRDNVGIVRPGADGLWHWFLDTDQDPLAEQVIAFGFPSDVPVVGDWDGDGRDNLGVARASGDGLWHWFLDLDKDPLAEIEKAFGLANSDTPIPGDWNGDGRDTLGVTRPGAEGLLHWFLDANGDIWADEERVYGFNTDKPMKGSWGTTTTPPDSDCCLSNAKPMGPLNKPITVNGTIDRASDVDMYAVSVVAGQRLWIDVDTTVASGKRLDSYLRVFDSAGKSISANDNGRALNEPAGTGTDSYLGITFSAPGTYYIGISNWQNRAYSPSTGNGTLGTNTSNLTGNYSLTVTLAASAAKGFNIEIVAQNLTSSQREVFKAAETRWESVIIGDLPNAVYEGAQVDDLRIDARFEAIDGTGNFLAFAGPDKLRSGSFLPYHGSMRFDTADVAAMERDGTLYDVILHEMGHVVGVGTLWDEKRLIQGIGGSDPRYTGARAVAEYKSIFQTNQSSIPVENLGPVGTRDAHWRESVFENEIMTGLIEGPGVRMPLSRITAASLADLGYAVDMNAADSYTKPSGVAASPVLLAGGTATVAKDPSTSPAVKNTARKTSSQSTGITAAIQSQDKVGSQSPQSIVGAGRSTHTWPDLIDSVMAQLGADV